MQTYSRSLHGPVYPISYLTSSRLVLCLLIMILTSACGGYFQASDQEEDATTSELTERDLESMFSRMSTSLFDSNLMRLWSAYHRSGKPIKLGVLAVEDQVKPPMTTSLIRLMKSLEGELSTDGEVITVSRSSQPKLLQGLRDPKDPALNRQKVAQLGEELGVQYLLTGKLYSVSDSVSDSASDEQSSSDQVQYFLFMQVIEVKTGAVRWQMEIETLKRG